MLELLAHQQPKAATANPADFYDMGFVKKIDESGFLRSIGAKK